MRKIRIVLTAIFSIFSAVGIATVLLGKAPATSLIVALAYIVTTMALYDKGGKPSKFVAYFTGCILSLGVIGSIYALILPLIGDSFEPLLFVSTLFIGLIGITTITHLKRQTRLV
ncbi:hypothetical protein Q4575_19505 [Psychrosphaera sp. 1_MG-2023]|uniref:hypothetical protein n=1 Tax=Psychrosphaera sp. 1_MG-2023 TaxID=3062643 RepID=UPI0026E486F0|nr:hypothetical protein [Psychrosphaera sp. 1_MG-2023]MDO6721595.1 hypothetical protein [Psychrosphaera sp. 1_MG-2023]